MLFRKKGTSSSVLAVALLVAILASVNSITNYINLQAEWLSGFASIGDAYMILSKNSTSITDSEVDAKLANLLSDVTDVEYVLPQKLFVANLVTKSGNHTTLIRGVENVQAFFDVRKAYIEGAVVGPNETQANVGEILARLASIDMEDVVSVVVDNISLNLKVVGIAKTLTQSDSEVIIPMKIAVHLFGKGDKVSLIEFAPKHSNKENEIISQIIELMPLNVKVVKVQQLKTFIQNINHQTAFFLDVWASVVYAVVVAASYVVAISLISQANYDLATLRALGAKRKLTFKLVLTYTIAVALLGFTVGLAIGIAGTQIASTAVRWMLPEVEITPFLEVGQALQIFMLTLASSALGCIYPALKSTHRTYMEQFQ